MPGRIYLKPKVGEIVLWSAPRSPELVWADEVVMVAEHHHRYPGSYLRSIYLRGGCMIDQRHVLALLPAGSKLDPLRAVRWRGQ